MTGSSSQVMSKGSRLAANLAMAVVRVSQPWLTSIMIWMSGTQGGAHVADIDHVPRPG